MGKNLFFWFVTSQRNPAKVSISISLILSISLSLSNSLDGD